MFQSTNGINPPICFNPPTVPIPQYVSIPNVINPPICFNPSTASIPQYVSRPQRHQFPNMFQATNGIVICLPNQSTIKNIYSVSKVQNKSSPLLLFIPVYSRGHSSSPGTRSRLRSRNGRRVWLMLPQTRRCFPQAVRIGSVLYPPDGGSLKFYFGSHSQGNRLKFYQQEDTVKMQMLLLCVVFLLYSIVYSLKRKFVFRISRRQAIYHLYSSINMFTNYLKYLRVLSNFIQFCNSI